MNLGDRGEWSKLVYDELFARYIEYLGPLDLLSFLFFPSIFCVLSPPFLYLFISKLSGWMYGSLGIIYP